MSTLAGFGFAVLFGITLTSFANSGLCAEDRSVWGVSVSGVGDVSGVGGVGLVDMVAAYGIL